MEDEVELRQLARDALHEGRLPPRRPDRMWGGPGGGHLCAICAIAIDRDQMGFDLEFASADSGGGDVINCHLHVRCFAAWEFERDACKADGRSAHVNGRNGSDLHAPTLEGTITDRERERLHSNGGIR
jgi:hypothetical protein